MLYCSFYACNVPSLYFLCPLTHCCSSSDLPGFLPAEKMLMAIKSAYSASLSCSSFIPFENSKMGLMNSNCRPATNRREQGEAVTTGFPLSPFLSWKSLPEIDCNTPGSGEDRQAGTNPYIMLQWIFPLHPLLVSTSNNGWRVRF